MIIDKPLATESRPRPHVTEFRRARLSFMVFASAQMASGLLFTALAPRWRTWLSPPAAADAFWWSLLAHRVVGLLALVTLTVGWWQLRDTAAGRRARICAWIALWWSVAQAVHLPVGGLWPDAPLLLHALTNANLVELLALPLFLVTLGRLAAAPRAVLTLGWLGYGAVATCWAIRVARILDPPHGRGGLMLIAVAGMLSWALAFLLAARRLGQAAEPATATAP